MNFIKLPIRPRGFDNAPAKEVIINTNQIREVWYDKDENKTFLQFVPYFDYTTGRYAGDVPHNEAVFDCAEVVGLSVESVLSMLNPTAQHEKQVLAVLLARWEILRNVLYGDSCKPEDRDYYHGKADGYQQAIDLLKAPDPALAVELEKPDKK